MPYVKGHFKGAIQKFAEVQSLQDMNKYPIAFVHCIHCASAFAICNYVTVGLCMFPLKSSPFCEGIWTPYGSLDLHESVPKQHLDQFSLLICCTCGPCSQHTDTQTNLSYIWCLCTACRRCGTSWSLGCRCVSKKMWVCNKVIVEDHTTPCCCITCWYIWHVILKIAMGLVFVQTYNFLPIRIIAAHSAMATTSTKWFIWMRWICVSCFWQIRSVAELLEFELFRQHRQLVTNSYHRATRRLVLSLRRNESLRREVCDNKECVAQLVTELCCGRELTDGLLQKSQASTSEPVDCS